MSKIFRRAHARRVGILLASGLACAVVPAVASASAVNLGTARPFVVLGGSTVTNTGPSVLNGELGLAPGTSLTGFGLPAVVNGATHDDDAVASQAKGDLTTAYNVAAGQPVTADLTGQDLGGKTLTPGAYSFSSSAGLTGRLTLNAQGNPNAQFVFEIGSTLTTASASSIVLTNGASPCNVYWQVGSSATLGTGTAFKGNLMAHVSITLNSASTVQGRLLASIGAVVLHNNVIDGSMCGTNTTPPPGGPTPTPPTGTPPTGTPPPPSHTTVPTRRGSGKLTRTSPKRCTAGFRATVRGREIKRVVFRIDGKWFAARARSPFWVHIPPAFAKTGHLQARVTFKDATRARTLRLRYRACAAAAVHPRPAPGAFTG
jgi:Ice-binding-like